jgi:hypothetical protein
LLLLLRPAQLPSTMNTSCNAASLEALLLLLLH